MAHIENPGHAAATVTGMTGDGQGTGVVNVAGAPREVD